jgi:hypothetical protein
LKEQLDSANEVLAGYKEKEEEMAKKEKALKRRASLVEAGLDDEAAEAAVAKFENLDDDSFDSIATFLTEAAVKMMKTKGPQKQKPLLRLPTLTTLRLTKKLISPSLMKKFLPSKLLVQL